MFHSRYAQGILEDKISKKMARMMSADRPLPKKLQDVLDKHEHGPVIKKVLAKFKKTSTGAGMAKMSGDSPAVVDTVRPFVVCPRSFQR